MGRQLMGGLSARRLTGRAGALGAIEDPETIGRLTTRTGLAAALSTAGFAALFFGFDEPAAGWATLGLAGSYLLFWLVFVSGKVSGRLVAVVSVMTIIAAANHVIVHVALGGFANSGGYLIWGVSVTLTASLVLPRVRTIAVTVFYCAAAVGLGINEAALMASRPPPAQPLPTLLFVIVIIGNFMMLVPLFGYFLERLAEERARAEALLANVLPVEIADELKRTGRAAARRFDSVTVLFADLVGFTAHSKDSDPEQIASELNSIFTRFDELAADCGAEKIKTIGDGYMAACGLPSPDPDHVQHTCDLALSMLDAMPDLNARLGTDFRLRVGVHTGSAVAGIVGKSKFSYDVWGDTVNLASRLESQGVPGLVVTSADVARAMAGRDYVFEPLGIRDLKGQGPTKIYSIARRRPRPGESDRPHLSRDG